MGMDEAVLYGHTIQQRSGCYTGGGEDGICTDHFVQIVLAVQIGDTDPGSTGALVGVAEHQPALELTPDAFQGRAGKHALGRAAGTDVQVYAGLGVSRIHDPGNVTVGDQINTSTDFAQACDDFGMAGAVQHADGDFGGLDALGLGQRTDVVGWTLVQVDHAGRIARTAGNLVHIGVGRIQHGALGRPGHHRQRVGHGFGCQCGALQRVQRNVDLMFTALADFFADIEHRRFVALALADHDLAVNIEIVQRRTHGVDRSLIGFLFVAPAYEFPCGDGGGLGHTDGVQHQAAVQNFRAHVDFPTLRSAPYSTIVLKSQIRAMRNIRG